MTKPIAATFADFKMIKTRGVVSLAFEIPIEQADAALAALGGVPQPASERWVAIALLAEKEAQSDPVAQTDEHQVPDLKVAGSIPAGVAKPKRPFSELSPTTQAGIRCEDAEFHRYLSVRFWSINNVILDPVDFVRRHCGVASRADLDKQLIAGKKWRELEAEFQAWRTDQRYAGVRR